MKRKVFFSFFIVFLTLLFLETALRIIGIKPIYPNSCRKYDPLLYYSFVPNTSCHFKTREWDITYKINSFGLRDYEYALNKPQNTYRILMLGDSFVEGYGVNIENSYSKILEKALNENSSSKVEIIDAGVQAWSTLNEYLYLKNFGIKLNPNLVILNFNMTDFYDDYQFNKKITKEEKFNLPEKEQINKSDYFLRFKLFLDNNSVVYNILQRKIKAILNKDTNNSDPKDATLDMFALTRVEKPKNYDQVFSITSQNILNIKKILDEKKIDFFIVEIPHGHMVGKNEWQLGRAVWRLEKDKVYSDWAFADLNSWAKTKNIETSNLTPILRLAAKNQKLYFDYDGHLNKNGQYAVAQTFFSLLWNKLNLENNKN